MKYIEIKPHSDVGDPWHWCPLSKTKVRYSDTVIQWDGQRVSKYWADKKPAHLYKRPTYPNENKPKDKTINREPAAQALDPTISTVTDPALPSHQ